MASRDLSPRLDRWDSILFRSTFLSHAFRVLPAGIAYAVWSGLGTALVTLGSYAILRQDIGIRALAGIVLILAGVIVLKGGQA